MICANTRIHTDPSLLRVVGLAIDRPSVSADGVVTLTPKRHRRPDNPFEKYHAHIRRDLPRLNLRQRTADAAVRVEAWIRAYQAGTPYATIMADSGVSRPAFVRMIRQYLDTDFEALLIRPRRRYGGRRTVLDLAAIRPDLHHNPMTARTAAAVARVEAMIRRVQARATVRAIAAQYNISRTRLYELLEWYQNLGYKPQRQPRPLKRRGRKMLPSRLAPADVAAWQAGTATIVSLAAKYNVSPNTMYRWVAHGGDITAPPTDKILLAAVLN